MKLILLDIDIKYEYMVKYKLLDILIDKIKYCMEKFNANPTHVKIRLSQCGNTHVHILIDKDLDPEDIIRLKYCIGEDHKRLTHTIRRYEKTGKILDFFWNKKVKVCKED